MPWAAKETVKRTTSKERGGEAVFALAEQAGDEDDGGHQPDSAEAGRGDGRHRPLALAGGQFSLRFAGGEDLDSALREPGRGSRRETQHRKPKYDENRKCSG